MGPLSWYRRSLRWVEGVAHDARLSVLALARHPVFTATAVLVLALGIGVNNMFFTLVYAHTMRGLPVAHPERILCVSTLDERGTVDSSAPQSRSRPDRLCSRAARGPGPFVLLARSLGDTSQVARALKEAVP